MDVPFFLLEQLQSRLLHEKLSCLPSYRKARQDSQALWQSFCAHQPSEAREQALDLLDSHGAVSALAQDAAFCLGLQLGLELGRLERFWETDG
ncbi:hypothetical protein [Pseudoflavonifractor phocaeensis]|uniref:hypothetical protein n=1 Tax=Pseudoflavonifractor phocaeensis TaxID=1870988 RepID=UPI00195E6D58|nr:hypothetical protein [Pseudoflavonifractor phocaeensis]MBM6925083.1 hypothetical protein [Pseudoflavonifractor phocaeensis]